MPKDKSKSTKPDLLVKAGKKGGIELSESDLEKVGGGDANKATTSGPTENLSLNFTKIETSYH